MTRTTPILLLALLGGCATSHVLPAAPDGGLDVPECLAWGHPEGLPEDVRCIEWAGDDAGARGCRVEPFYHPNDPGAGACAY